MKGSFVIFRFRGIPVSVHWTFAILIGWVLLSGKNSQESWWSVAFVLTIFLCVILHEMAHALVADRFGIKATNIMLLPIGGVARFARMPKKAAHELAIAVAGPLTNLLIAALLFLPVRKELNSGMEQALVAVNGHNFLVNLFIVNLALGVFNLVPAFPMDGGRILRAALSLKWSNVAATKAAVYIAQALAIAFVVIGLSSNESVNTSPTLLFISLFIFFGAQAELQSVSFRSVLGGHHLSEVTMREFGQLKITDRLKDAVALMLDSSYHDFLVMDGGRVAGILSRSHLIKALRESGEEGLVAHHMSTDIKTAVATASLESGYEQIQQPGSRLLIVNDNERLLGIVDAENILEFVMARQAVSK